MGVPEKLVIYLNIFYWSFLFLAKYPFQKHPGFLLYLGDFYILSMDMMANGKNLYNLPGYIFEAYIILFKSMF